MTWFAAGRVSAALGVFTLACGAGRVITVKQTKLDGNSEYFVCEGAKGTNCRGERLGDVDPAGYQTRIEVHTPYDACPNGVANLEIVLDGDDVQRVRYECAQPALPTGLPSSSGGSGGGPSEPGPGTGLPPAAPDDSSAPPSRGAAGGAP